MEGRINGLYWLEADLRRQQVDRILGALRRAIGDRIQPTADNTCAAAASSPPGRRRAKPSCAAVCDKVNSTREADLRPDGRRVAGRPARRCLPDAEGLTPLNFCAALHASEIALHRDWLFDDAREIEFQDFMTLASLTTELDDRVAAAQAALDGHSGLRGIHGPFEGLDIDN